MIKFHIISLQLIYLAFELLYHCFALAFFDWKWNTSKSASSLGAHQKPTTTIYRRGSPSHLLTILHFHSTSPHLPHESLRTLESMSHGVETEKVNDLISPESDSKQGGADTSPSTEADNETRSAVDEASPRKEVGPVLRHVSDKLPWGAWLVVAFSSAERFSYFAFTGPLRKCASLTPSKIRHLMWRSRKLY